MSRQPTRYGFERRGAALQWSAVECMACGHHGVAAVSNPTAASVIDAAWPYWPHRTASTAPKYDAYLNMRFYLNMTPFLRSRWLSTTATRRAAEPAPRSALPCQPTSQQTYNVCCLLEFMRCLIVKPSGNAGHVRLPATWALFDGAWGLGFRGPGLGVRA